MGSIIRQKMNEQGRAIKTIFLGNFTATKKAFFLLIFFFAKLSTSTFYTHLQPKFCPLPQKVVFLLRN